ncbi:MULTISPECIES: antitoxin VbhA family protein [unclassified Microbacterium]|uniref:antitoxin VbhA family protein n=1 Tax=Microbacterium sp. K22 TaxID=2305447 RepID=UPI001443A931
MTNGPQRSREERLNGVLEAFHSCQLDGLQPTRAAVRDGWDYVEGRRTLDEIIEDVVRRHTRRPEDQQ